MFTRARMMALIWLAGCGVAVAMGDDAATSLACEIGLIPPSERLQWELGTTDSMRIALLNDLLHDDPLVPAPPMVWLDDATTACSQPHELPTTFAAAILTAPPGWPPRMDVAPPPVRRGAIVGGQVLINQANADELIEVLQVDRTRALAILEYREAIGIYRAPEELSEVFGIDDALAARLRDKILIEE